MRNVSMIVVFSFYLIFLLLPLSSQFSLLSDKKTSASRIINYFLNFNRKPPTSIEYFRSSSHYSGNLRSEESNRKLEETTDEVEVIENVTTTQQITSDFMVTSPKTMTIKMSMDIEMSKKGSYFSPVFFLTPQHTPSQTPTGQDILYSLYRRKEYDSNAKWEEMLTFTPITTVSDTPLDMNPINYKRNYTFSYRLDSYNENKIFLASATVRYKAYIPKTTILDAEEDKWPFWKILIIVLAGVLAIVLIIFIVFICSTKSDMNDELLDKSKETNGSSRENTESTTAYNEEEERKRKIIEDEKRRKSSVFNPVIKNEKMVVSQFHPMQEIELAEKN